MPLYLLDRLTPDRLWPIRAARHCFLIAYHFGAALLTLNLSLDIAVLIANNGSYLLSLSKPFVKGGEVDPNYSFFT